MLDKNSPPPPHDTVPSTTCSYCYCYSCKDDFINYVINSNCSLIICSPISEWMNRLMLTLCSLIWCNLQDNFKQFRWANKINKNYQWLSSERTIFVFIYLLKDLREKRERFSIKYRMMRWKFTIFWIRIIFKFV